MSLIKSKVVLMLFVTGCHFDVGHAVRVLGGAK